MNCSLIKNNRGFFFSISVIILILPLIVFISFYKHIPETQMKDTISRLRCDKINFFVEDIKRDMSRAMEISVKRALVSAFEYVVETGKGLENYTFNCSKNCDFNCSDFEYNMNGSTAALTELTLCGTLYGKNRSKMKNHTFTLWFNKILNYSSRMHYKVNFEILSMDMGHRDAFTIYSLPKIRLDIRDVNGICFYDDMVESIEANTSIIGLHDPLYTLNTRGFGKKTIINCSIESPIREKIVGCSKDNISNGSGRGWVIFYTDIGGTPGDLNNYCVNTPPKKIANQILVFDDTLPPNLCSTWPNIKECLNSSSPAHFAGIIVYTPADLSALCNATIPWISSTGDLDDFPGSPPRATSCGINSNENITNESCTYITTNHDCNIHKVGLGNKSGIIKTKCYTVSDINETYNMFCSEKYKNGPSFLDRLDGRSNLSEKYVEQTKKRYNTTLIGIETFVDVYELKNYSSIRINKNNTIVDYLFWQNVKGCPVLATCEDRGYAIRLDCPHVLKYNMDTVCISSKGCCGDGICQTWLGEDCGNCRIDCPLCPDGCPNVLAIRNCSTCSNPSNCNLSYILKIYDNKNKLIDSSGYPLINITYNIPPGVSVNDTMMRSGIGIYNYIIHNVNGNKKAYANITVISSGCPTITNSTYPIRVNTMPSC